MAKTGGTRVEQPSRPVRFASQIIVALLVFLAVFTGVMIVEFWMFQTTPDTLIISVFGVIAAEFMSLAAKRIFEKRSGDSGKNDDGEGEKDD